MAIPVAATGSLYAAIAALIVVVLAALALGRCVLGRCVLGRCVLGGSASGGWPTRLSPLHALKGQPARPDLAAADRAGGLMRFAVGFNLLGLLAVCLSLLGAGGSTVAALSLCGLAVVELICLGAGGLRSWLFERRSAASPGSQENSAGSPKNASWSLRQPGIVAAMKNHWVLLLLGGLTLGPALDRPEGWDELVYHAELPLRWRHDGQMAVYPDLPYSGFPSLGEAVTWLATPLEHVIAPRLILWSTWMAGLALLQICLRQLVSPLTAQVLLSSFALCDTVLLVSGSCYVEAILMMNVAAILLWMVRPEVLPSNVWRSSLAIAIFTGGAAAVKLTAAAIGAVPLFILLFREWSLARPGRGKLVGRMAVTGFAALCFLFPFYLRPYLATGNPLFPFFDDWFTSDVARVESSHFHHAIAGQVFGVEGVAARLMSPVLLAMDQNLFDGTFGYQSWLWLGLIAFGLRTACLRRRIRWESLVLTASAVLLYACWSATTQQARFAIPAAMCLLVLAAIALRELHWSAASRRWLLMALMLCTLVSAPWLTASYYLGGWMSAIGLMDPFVSTDEATGGEYLPLTLAIAENTPADAHILMLFEHRGFYVPRRHSLGTPFFQSRFFTPAEIFNTGASIQTALRAEGISHVVLSVAHAGPDYAPGWADRLPAFLSGLEQAIADGSLRLVWEAGRYKIFQVAEPQGSQAPAIRS